MLYKTHVVDAHILYVLYVLYTAPAVDVTQSTLRHFVDIHVKSTPRALYGSVMFKQYASLKFHFHHVKPVNVMFTCNNRDISNLLATVFFKKRNSLKRNHECGVSGVFCVIE